MLDNLNEFMEFPTVDSDMYKNFQKNLIKFDEENLNTKENEKYFYNAIIKQLFNNLYIL